MDFSDMFHVSLTINHIMTFRGVPFLLADNATDALIYVIDLPVRHEHLFLGPLFDRTVTSRLRMSIHRTFHFLLPWSRWPTKYKDKFMYLYGFGTVIVPHFIVASSLRAVFNTNASPSCVVVSHRRKCLLDT